MTENTIEKLNSLGITDVTTGLHFWIGVYEKVAEIIELYKTDGWGFYNIDGVFISITNIKHPSEQFITELKALGVDGIIETLQITVYTQTDTKNVYGTLRCGKWDSFRMDRQLMNTDDGDVPLDIWYFRAERCL